MFLTLLPYIETRVFGVFLINKGLRIRILLISHNDLVLKHLLLLTYAFKEIGTLVQLVVILVCTRD